MRKFLLILGIFLILLGLIAAMRTLTVMGGVRGFVTGSTEYPLIIGHAVFCAMLYAAGFTALYLGRWLPS